LTILTNTRSLECTIKGNDFSDISSLDLSIKYRSLYKVLRHWIKEISKYYRISTYTRNL